MKTLIAIAFISALLSSSYCCSAEKNSAFSFALIGDMPYGVGASASSRALNLLLAQINADKDLLWVIHAGDIKTGSQSCGNKFLQSRNELFAKFQPAFVLTPGDNDWTDCHRPTAGNYDPLERLDRLRQLFFSHAHTKLKTICTHYLTQAQGDERFSEFVENILWQKNDIVFATIHLVGSANGTAKFSSLSKIKRARAHDQEVKRRSKAARAWLKTVFKHAKKNQLTGVFLTIHANPGFSELADEEDRKPFKEFLQQLHRQARSFDGRVVLAHGDSHKFRIDQPSFGSGVKAPANFTRIETFGETDSNWIKVEVDPATPEVFSFAPILNRP